MSLFQRAISQLARQGGCMLPALVACVAAIAPSTAHAQD
ncbi:MAG: hypothetical protein RIR10_2199, partial [Planctomycetota bacterium]